jgi:4-amino-4-deoxy-L-arabinose transferase-like glycosyltransferase
MLITHYPGWRVTVDGRPAILENVGGYLATRMENGVHRYRFEFVPLTFYLGLIISLISFSFGCYLLIVDYQLSRRQLVEKWAEFKGRLEKIRHTPWIPEAHDRAIVRGYYINGVFQPEKPVKINDQSPVRLLVVAETENSSLPNLAWRQWTLASKGLTRAIIQSLSLAAVLFVFGLGVYLITRFTGLSKFPIYFFTDEAIQTLSAVDLVRDGFRDPNGQFLPTYFQNSSYYNLSVSVYAQVIPYLLFGKSIVVTRGVSVLISFLAALSIGWILKEIFKLSLWWLGPLLLGVVPAWFLHSRTAFETVIFVSFYSACLLSYLLYRYRSPNYLYLTLILAGLAFYSYSPGQMITVFTGLLLLISDYQYHWKNRHLIPAAILLSVVIALPYIRFRATHGDIATEHLKLLTSYWVQPIPLSEKIQHFVSEYAYGLSPAYWFIPNQHDLDRHLMKDYGLISLYWLPFVLVGLGICIWKSRSSMYRTLLLAIFAVPIGGALVGIGITRVLALVIPVPLLMAIGLEYCFKWLGALWLWLRKQYEFIAHLGNWKNPAWLLPLALFIFFSQVSFSMMKDALINVPNWYRDYGMGGLQYGAPQIFDAINEYLEEHKDVQIILSPSWANGTDIVARFFLSDDQPVKLGSIDGYLSSIYP